MPSKLGENVTSCILQAMQKTREANMRLCVESVREEILQIREELKTSSGSCLREKLQGVRQNLNTIQERFSGHQGLKAELQKLADELQKLREVIVASVEQRPATQAQQPRGWKCVDGRWVKK